MGDYVVPLLQGALKLDGMCRVRWLGLVNDLTFKLDKLSEAAGTPPPNLSEEMKTVDTPQKAKKIRKPK
ncbi:hypothetical protein BC936DRAFT_145438 [Jimgerdemannia flammicorona]|uniref:Uncharacterized protein n=1 Tax=Jimgerdemannia flammicorona TaxID=994334 RepID=A0A433DMA8_9FUNG|nr:hypothetical protein BC936DRAFT_145438 [Jimgerdemannia flammicorona]